MTFQLNETYTRIEIGDRLGGSKQAFLPTVQGKVVCGCFDPNENVNPEAPEEVQWPTRGKFHGLLRFERV